ncbi:TIGR02680 family protein [Tumebacillus flagellatus]|uniref:TIGR02680 family protein n=1 Tax=Tumebacillus flagellatus TaxID=1157490 RepID=A0A074M4I1_9BACL|nr:TIGR02680 family protein [Tumebacillus flagellatus]KEO80917.1 hypothetical protein EL26_23635 [Tumebacillus flagellatus]
MNRWQLSRAGIFNFWYYDEQEFHLQSGRILFRGANGAGKSVTMQSFLPLVLDGDTRPFRLDPFGSRDRKIEYYLLGEDGEHTDRTGYLWMEFYLAQQDRYQTIGIGLRARRGKSQLDFWGFALTDGRRIGRDFHLYQNDYAQGEEARIPLDWKALRDRIGAGGQVVQERKEYRRLVNKLLFKYDNVKHFQEMLDLLIQLRSPKLSKDFKPTTIYEILNSGLPPLQEEELRPLAEVLESIDQIGDRKQELELHVHFAKHLADAYGKYNQFQLYQTAHQVIQTDGERAEAEHNIQKKQAQSEQQSQELEQVNTEIETSLQTERTARAEIGILEQDEAFEKERELENKREQQKRVQEEMNKTQTRLEMWQNRYAAVDKRMRAQIEKRDQHASKQQDLLLDLEALARDVEFRYHDVFHGRFSREIPDDALLFDSWKRGIDDHEQALKEALECARQHQQAKKQVQDQERELGIATERRDHAEASLQAAESQLLHTKEEQQAKLFTWRKEARIFKLEDAEMTRVLHLLSSFPEVAYEEITAAAQERSGTLYQSIWQERAQAEAEKGRLVAAEQEKQREIQTWKNQREPEPPRSASREQTRGTYADRNITGVPLYAACEFHPQVREELRAVLETVLQETGLLDAWIGGNSLQVTREDEEFWVQAAPLDFGYTLADFLKPTPPEDRSVTAEQIDSLLRSIEVGEPLTASERVVISVDGQFRMGTLAGKVRPKSRAEYIGKESRRQTRMAMISRLEQEILELKACIERQDQVLRFLQERESALSLDLAAFPSGAELMAARNALQTAKDRWSMAVEELERKNTSCKAAMQVESGIRQRLHVLTQEYTSLKDEARLKMAVDQFRTYLNDFFELRSQWNQYVQVQKSIVRDEQELKEAGEQVENEREHLDEYLRQSREVEAVIQAFENTLKEMGVAEKYRQLTQLRELAARMSAQARELGDRKSDLTVDLRTSARELQSLQDELQKITVKLQARLQEWRYERSLQLVSIWREQPLLESTEEDVKLCHRMYQTYKSSFENRRSEGVLNSLFTVVNEVRSHLHDYVLEMEADPNTNSRQLIRFNYDRKHPVTPEYLLFELEKMLEEQNVLLSDKEKELLEKVLIQSVGVSIREKIQRAEEWVKEMNELMRQRQTSSGLQLQLKWEPRPKRSESEMDTSELVALLRVDYEHLTEEKREQIHAHFQDKIKTAKQEAENYQSLRQVIHEFLDYRDWYRFKLRFKKGDRVDYRDLSDSSFNVMSGGEKAMSMYIPLFAAVSSRYKGSSPESPQVISLDEAFAGVDEENVRDMFGLLTQMGFDYMMTSQVLWGCFDTVPGLAIYEIVRPKDADEVIAISYVWNGRERIVNFDGLEQNLAG